MKFDYKKTTDSLLSNVSERSKIIISRRFALGKSKIETLEKIGKDYGITRERVRQIELDGIKKINKKLKGSENKNQFREIEDFFIEKLEKAGGVKREDLFLESLGDKKDIACITFLLNLSEKCFKEKEDKKFHAFWCLNKKQAKKVKELDLELIKEFKENKELLSLKKISEILGVEDKKALKSFLEISKEFSKTIDGKKYGLVSWPEVNPKTVRDKIYFILKQKKNPLHYKDIAKDISKLNSELFADSVSVKELHPQTIHNELIRNGKFVLIGRGIYALKEWGYNEGQVKDVILEILKSNQESLPKERIVQLVSEKRIVRESTILLNLQNKKMFSRDGSGKYRIREI